MEPSTDSSATSSPYGSLPHTTHAAAGPRLSDILARESGAARKLPMPSVPKVAVSDMLNPVGSDLRVHSGTSSAAGSQAGGDLHERY